VVSFAADRVLPVNPVVPNSASFSALQLLMKSQAFIKLRFPVAVFTFKISGPNFTIHLLHQIFYLMYGALNIDK